MKRALARKWAKALESGDYQQTTGELRNSEGWCCLGVLCNIHAQDNPDMAAQQESQWSYFGADTYLPSVVAEWANMRSREGDLITPIVVSEESEWVEVNTASSLVELNDEYDYDFKAIAKIIRKHWKDL